MKKRTIIKLALLGVFFLLIWKWYYNNHYNKESHKFSSIISDGIYEEVFLLSASGVLANDLYSCYITDSINFRKFVGRFDNKEKYIFDLANRDTIKSVRYSRRIYYGKSIPIDTLYFSISKLKEEGDFD
jgi:hypothetical protein